MKYFTEQRGIEAKIQDRMVKFVDWKYVENVCSNIEDLARQMVFNRLNYVEDLEAEIEVLKSIFDKAEEKAYLEIMREEERDFSYLEEE